MTTIEKMISRGITPRAALYARFSSTSQREESIEAQLRAMHEFCKNNRIEIVKEYCDRAKSAVTDNRPEFLNMIAESKYGNFDFVIVHKLDRFARNRYDSAFYKRELRRNGIALLSVLEQMDDSPESIILESILEGMSEYYSKNLAREVMKGMKESARECKYIGGFVPFGFNVDKETKKYVVNEHEAKAVQIIFEEIAKGKSYGQVMNKINGMGYRTKQGKPFKRTTIYEILRNEKYKGTYVFNRVSARSATGKRNNHKSKPEDEIIKIPGGVPQIVDDETFEKVQMILKARKRSDPKTETKQ